MFSTSKLQELLAPHTVVFYSADWQPLGNKRSLATALTAITKIDQDILDGSKPVESGSIAQRMSWAAERKTTRTEDRAYSLMGLFGVNMPMLYGEGEKAFQRLQQEIMKLSDDQTIFCWSDPRYSGNTRHGLLADSPDAFRHASKFRAYSAFDDLHPFDMSNRGLSIRLPVSPTEDKDIFTGALHCPVPTTNDGFLCIYLLKLSSGEQQFARIRCDQLVSISRRGDWRNIYVRPSFPQQDDDASVLPTHYFLLRKFGSTTPGIKYDLQNAAGYKVDATDLSIPNEINLNNPQQMTKLHKAFQMVKAKGSLTVSFRFRREDGEMVVVLLGALTDVEPGFDVHECDPSDLRSFQELEGNFNPEPMGDTLGVQYHTVTVRAETMIKHGIKVYLMDVFIKGEPKIEEEDLAQRLDGVKVDTSNRLSKMKKMFNNIVSD